MLEVAAGQIFAAAAGRIFAVAGRRSAALCILAAVAAVAAVAPSKSDHRPFGECKTVAAAGCSGSAPWLEQAGRSAAERGEKILPGVPSNPPAQRLHKVATQLLHLHKVRETQLGILL